MSISITTDTQLRKAIRQVVQTGEQVALPLAGYKGLEIRIRPSGNDATATFRHRYKKPYTTKRPYMTLGQYPFMTLEQARRAHHDNMALLAQSIDPMTHREQEHLAQIAALNNGFADVATRWFNDKTSNKDNMPANGTVLSWRRAIDVAIDEWGDTPIQDITPPMVLKLCKHLQTDRITLGSRVRSITERIFTYAIGHGLIDNNPASTIKGLLQTGKTTHQPAIISPIPFGQLLNDLDALDDSNERTALQLMALLFTRGGDMVAAKWSDIDMDKEQWTLTPQKAGGRSDMVNSLIIPLPKQAITLLKEQHKKTGMYEHIFHSHKTLKAPHMGTHRLNYTINDIKDGYYKGKHVPHGFRAAALTMLQEQLGYPHYLADMALGHSVKDINGGAYNRAQFIEERREMMQAWADYQDKLRAGKTVIRGNFKKTKMQKLG